MIHYLAGTLHYFEDYVGRTFLAAAVIAVMEWVLPRSRYSLISRVRAVSFWVAYIAITAAAFTLFWDLWGRLGVPPLFHINLAGLSTSSNVIVAAAGGMVASLAPVFAFDFFYYWFHRLQHKSPFLWRFHAVHHSIAEMSAFNSNHHFTEEIFRIPFVVMPTTLLFSFDQGYVPWVWASLLGWQGIYEHSATRLHFGWFRYIIPDNRFHRIHHSLQPEHFHKNFGSGSAIWDIVFGTAHFPRREEWPEVGLDRAIEPKSLKDFLWRPFLPQAGVRAAVNFGFNGDLSSR
ncbi:MAG TPA: sterol desaturase family protein [Xanthobacteraceae bacterium]|jgi:sterol desaturase/sphingolipid hydroxylase (fatty acid hydroxylase superfamily)|nr:sterol desaturase family protein [Xanthobacteraceae bacterium]